MHNPEPAGMPVKHVKPNRSQPLTSLNRPRRLVEAWWALLLVFAVAPASDNLEHSRMLLAQSCFLNEGIRYFMFSRSSV